MSSKKRKHEKRQLSSSDEEPAIVAQQKRANTEETSRKTKGPSDESKLKFRIRNYLTQNQDADYIDVDDMAQTLHEKYQNYSRIKLKEFKKQVQIVFGKMSNNQKKAEATNSKATKEPSENKTRTSNGNSKAKPATAKSEMKKVVKISDESSDDEDTKTDPTRVPGKNMNHTINKLYSSPKTDFDKIKSVAKVLEKTLSSDSKTDTKKITSDNESKGSKAPEKTFEESILEKPVATKPGKGAGVDEEDKSKAKAVGGNADVEMIDLEPDQPKSVKTSSKESSNAVLDASQSRAEKSRPTSPAPLKASKKRKMETTFKEAKVNFSNVAGMEDTLMSLVNAMIGYKYCQNAKKRPLLLHGPTGCGKTLLANAIAGELSWPLLEITATEIVSGVSGESEAKLRSLFDQAITADRPCVLFMDEIEVIGQKQGSSTRGMDNRILAQLKSCIDGVKESQVLLVTATNGLESLDLALRSRFFEVAIGIPNEKARQKIIESVSSSLNLDENVNTSVLARNTPSYVGRDFEDLCTEAEKMALKRVIDSLVSDKDDLETRRKVLQSCENEQELSCHKIKMEDFSLALKKIQPAAKREGFATIPDVSWQDVGAMQEVRRNIELKVLARVNHPEAAKEFNLDSPTGVLLVGPPGCGKTLVAKAIANQAGINFISVKGPELLNMYVGESEKAVRQVFQRAKNSAPCVIFFDEIDALCPHRTSGSDNSGSNRVVTQMLTEMDGMEDRSGVYLIGATNREAIIDPAIKRPGRLETILYVGLPDQESRVQILNAITRGRTRPNVAADVDFEHISKSCEGFSGADLKALVTKASEVAFSEFIKNPVFNQKRVTMKHFEDALLSIRPSVQGKEKVRYEKTRLRLLPTEAETKAVVDTADVNATAEPTVAPLVTNGGGATSPDKSMDSFDDYIPTPFVIDSTVKTATRDTETVSSSSTVQKTDTVAEAVSEHTQEKNDRENVKENGKQEVNQPTSNGEEVKKEKLVECSLRFLPHMAVRVKDSHKTYGGKFAKVVHQKGSAVTLTHQQQEFVAQNHELEPFMPNPGDKARSLDKNETETILEVLRYDDLGDDDAVVVLDPVEDDECILKLDTLCRVNL